MEICIQFLRKSNLSRQSLCNRGWRLDDLQEGIRAFHPLVIDEESAREALWLAGLLTSGDVRIEFKRCADSGDPSL